MLIQSTAHRGPAAAILIACAGVLVASLAWSAPRPALCEELSRFAGTTALDQARRVTLTTYWTAAAEAFYEQRCDHEDRQAGARLCADLLSSISAASPQAGIADLLSCLGRRAWEPDEAVELQLFQFSVTPSEQLVDTPVEVGVRFESRTRAWILVLVFVGPNFDGEMWTD